MCVKGQGDINKCQDAGCYDRQDVGLCIFVGVNEFGVKILRCGSVELIMDLFLLMVISFCLVGPLEDYDVGWLSMQVWAPMVNKKKK